MGAFEQESVLGHMVLSLGMYVCMYVCVYIYIANTIAGYYAGPCIWFFGGLGA